MVRVVCADVAMMYSAWFGNVLSASKLHPLPLCRPKMLEKAVPFDVVVVGGGILGLATARELALRHPSLRLAVVEKERELGEGEGGCAIAVIMHTPEEDMCCNVLLEDCTVPAVVCQPCTRRATIVVWSTLASTTSLAPSRPGCV